MREEISEEVLQQAKRVFDSSTNGQPTPDGWLPIEAWTDGKRLCVLGTPVDGEEAGLPEEEWHNCDVMGCSSIGRHVVGIFELPNEVRLPTYMGWFYERALEGRVDDG